MNETAQALVELHSEQLALQTSYLVASLIFIFGTAAGMSCVLGALGWRRGYLGRNAKMVTIASGLLFAISLPAMSISTLSNGERAEALLDGALCEQVLSGISTGSLKFIDPESFASVSRACGHDKFVEAANSPGSVLSAGIDRSVLR